MTGSIWSNIKMNKSLNREIIWELNTPEQLITSTQVIRNSFKTVAAEFGLTEQNCPAHPSFITLERLNDLKSKGAQFFGLFTSGQQIGFVTIEKAYAETYYIEKLAVLPEYRHLGHGKTLVRFAQNYIRNNGGRKISITVIDEHTVLKKWYQELGFSEIGTKTFPHLPFTVCFMEMELNNQE